ncbi:MAG: glycosyltransferase family 2 protein [Acidobacteria bacterium]|nr:glycosyltransferase family 2 protein [Acidobacteriota bacterium]
MSSLGDKPIYLCPRPNPKLLSLVIPIFDEEEALPHLRKSLESLANKLPCLVEWILVNDGSKDLSREMLFQWAKADQRAKVVDLARNFGHQAAITAGLDHSIGDAVVIMDADLQDPPELILEMLVKYCEGYDVVFAQRIKRQGESLFKIVTAKAFYWIMSKFIHKQLPPDTGDFRLMSRPVVISLGYLREGQRFLRGMISWVGFSQTAVPFERLSRVAGKTKYPFYKMVKFAWEAILSFSSIPLKAAMILGVLVFFFGVSYGVYATIKALVYQDVVRGWTSIIILQSIIGGTILLCLGVIGEYVGRIYEEIKQRPIYIVKDCANLAIKSIPGRGVLAFNEYINEQKSIEKHSR